MFLVDTAATFGVDFGTGGTVGTVTVDITRGDGTLLVDDGATSDVGDGTYTFALSSALNDQIDLLRLIWTITSTDEQIHTNEEIVGNLLFTIAQARNKTITGQQTPLSSESSFPDSEIDRVREELTQQFEEITHKSWIRRYARMEFSGPGGRVLELDDGIARTVDGETAGGPGRFNNVGEIISASIGGTAVTLTDLVIDGATIFHTNGTWTRGTATDPFNVVVEYAYGHDPVPFEARDNGIREAIKRLVPSDISAYASTHSGGDGSTSFPAGGFVWTPRTFQWLKRHRPVLVG